MMLEDTGERLARRCLKFCSADAKRPWSATLADFLPERPIGWPCWPEIQSISSSIPLTILMGPGCSPESFTDKLYLLIERLRLDDQRCGEVLGFFRGFCRAFFRRPAPITEESGSDRQSTAASAQDLEAETPGLLNFNDLLAVLLDWCCPDQTVADLDPPLTTWNPNELIPELTRLIEAMDQDERLAPELLLGGFSSDRCVLRRKRLSYAAGLDLETVDVLMTMLSSLRRLYRNAPPAFISAGHP